jgi:hypothetical protein
MHIARRIEEMCIRVDFDKTAVVEAQPEIALSNFLEKVWKCSYARTNRTQSSVDQAIVSYAGYR